MYHYYSRTRASRTNETGKIDVCVGHADGVRLGGGGELANHNHPRGYLADIVGPSIVTCLCFSSRNVAGRGPRAHAAFFQLN